MSVAYFLLKSRPVHFLKFICQCEAVISSVSEFNLNESADLLIFELCTPDRTIYAHSVVSVITFLSPHPFSAWCVASLSNSAPLDTKRRGL